VSTKQIAVQTIDDFIIKAGKVATNGEIAFSLMKPVKKLTKAYGVHDTKKLTLKSNLLL
jgi:hypothetical protein